MGGSVTCADGSMWNNDSTLLMFVTNHGPPVLRRGGGGERERERQEFKHYYLSISLKQTTATVTT